MLLFVHIKILFIPNALFYCCAIFISILISNNYLFQIYNQFICDFFIIEEANLILNDLAALFSYQPMHVLFKQN